MSKKRKTDKQMQKTIAKNRIKKLFLMAEQKAFDSNFILADRYVDIARKISMRCLVPIPVEFKRSFCKHCYSYLLPSINSRTRINKGKIIIFCKNCQKYTRIPYKPKK
jgi:ribonuclease P protein subunit RPR2